MLNRVCDTLRLRSIAGLALALAACSSEGGGDETSGASTSATGTSDTPTTSPTTSGATDTSSTEVSGNSATGSTVGTSEPTSTTDDTTQGLDTSDVTTASDTSDVTTASDTSDTSGTGDPSSASDTSGTSDTSSTSTTDASSTSTTGDPADCVPTEMIEVSCDSIDNDCDESIDNVDVGNDGICDCLNIGILGGSGYAPNANFEAWLEDQGSAVTRTLLANNPGVVTPAFLAQFDLILVDRVVRALSAEEAAALAAFVKNDGRGMITLIGYNFDNLNPAPERDRANSALAPFGLAYQGGYFGNQVTPDFDPMHPVSKGIVDVNFNGGIAPADTGNQGTSTVFAKVGATNAGIAHQTAMEGGRVIVWGDEWITFDSDWQGYMDVQPFWVNLVSWAKPQDFCGAPQ